MLKPQYDRKGKCFLKGFVACIIGTMISAAVTMTFWLIGLLTSIVVYTQFVFPNILMFWIIAATATVVTDWIMKSPAGDYPMDLLIISPASTIVFVWLMNTVCQHPIWFASDMFTYGSWVGILAFIIANTILASATKTWAKSKFSSN